MTTAESLDAGRESGILLVDKPWGVTSHDVVSSLRSVLGTRHVGHAGTLDPMATGLLIVGFGKATRLLNYAMGSSKVYETTIRLGMSTTTDDLEGDPVVIPDASRGVERITREQVESLVSKRFMGVIDQTPSRFSAVRVQGRHAYELAREGHDFTIAPRRVTIRRFDVLELDPATVPDPRGVEGDTMNVVDVRARIECSSGTYIRSIARDLGEALGVGGHLVSLRRTAVGRFSVDEDGVTTAQSYNRTITRRDGERRTVMSARFADDDMVIRSRAVDMSTAAARMLPVVRIDSGMAARLRYGKTIDTVVEGATAAILSGSGRPGDSGCDELVAIVEPAGDHEARPRAVFPGASGPRGT